MQLVTWSPHLLERKMRTLERYDNVNFLKEEMTRLFFIEFVQVSHSSQAMIQRYAVTCVWFTGYCSRLHFICFKQDPFYVHQLGGESYIHHRDERTSSGWFIFLRLVCILNNFWLGKFRSELQFEIWKIIKVITYLIKDSQSIFSL